MAPDFHVRLDAADSRQTLSCEPTGSSVQSHGGVRVRVPFLPLKHAVVC